MSHDQLISKLILLGFSEVSREKYSKKISGYELVVDIDATNAERSAINYGTKIKVCHKGICNFKKKESFVQLECVIRLLEKGYNPCNIMLERQYKIGRTVKGRLDILLKNKNKTWAMIECKTYGTEYEQERDKVLADGGQIFSYFAQDRNAQIIGIYSSEIQSGNITFRSEQVITGTLDKAGDASDIYKSWDKQFCAKGIFEPSLGLYELKPTNLRKKDLTDLTRETGKGLFNDFAELLRRYVISDKSNAFNVIFNLFVCKIFDEDTKSDDEQLDFQWIIGDDYETLIARLSKLYYSSVKKYLNLEIDEAYFPKTSTGNSVAIKEFSFIEVSNLSTFGLNGAILADAVKSLQNYRIKYSTKHQFLGEFFEQLLNSGVKQESGQFFTPIPLARFILRSLPVGKIINQKIKSKEPHILPYIIDYACGSGHFLTESMTEVEAHFASIADGDLSGQQKRYFDSLKNNYLWAREYIYGIEKDSRLAKTTKIALFLNGDGDATIVSGDGLDDFTSASYLGRLKSYRKTKSVSTFDILVSNPPFSVEGFSNTLIDGETNFSLFSSVTKKSPEIECFFIERMCQLLNDNGVAGIILPLSILNNNRTVYIKARTMLLLNFRIVGIVELRGKAFMATTTAVVIVFLQKRSKQELLDLVKEGRNLSIRTDGQVNNLLDHCKEQAEKQNYLQDDCDGLLIEALKASVEREHSVIMAFSGEKKQQEYFLGYRFSRARGREGLTELKKGLLLDKHSLFGNNALATRMHTAFLGESPRYESSDLDKYVTSVAFSDIVSSKEAGSIISNPSSFLASKTVKIESLSPYGDFIDGYKLREYTLDQLVNSGRVVVVQGVVFDKAADEVPTETNIRVVTASNINKRTGLLDFSEKIIFLRDDFAYDPNLTIKENDIIISMASGSLGHLGKVAFATQDHTEIIGGFLNIIRAETKNLALALYFRLLSRVFREYAFSKKGQNINNISMNDIKKLKLELPENLEEFVCDTHFKNGTYRPSQNG